MAAAKDRGDCSRKDEDATLEGGAVGAVVDVDVDAEVVAEYNESKSMMGDRPEDDGKAYCAMMGAKTQTQLQQMIMLMTTRNHERWLSRASRLLDYCK